MRIVLSSPTEQKRPPCGSNATPHAWSVCASEKVCTHARDATSHTLTEWSLEHETMWESSGADARPSTHAAWPSSDVTSAPALTSNMLMWASSEPEKRVVESFEKASARTLSAWPSSLCNSLCVFTSKTVTAPSAEPHATLLPSGLNATLIRNFPLVASVCCFSPVSVDHRLMLPPCEPDATSRPSGDIETVHASTGPASISHSSMPRSRSHSRMCESRADEHAVLPSVLTLTDTTPSWWPLSWLRGSSSASGIVNVFTISSQEPVTIWLLGDQATDQMPSS
mmetsp:Transcript_10647/g.27838  ORF Transcript_10647/g.27838 Transcript_10647/m.27838 type:complete len:282 (-) Transcript_10647:83-928(-)